MRRAAVAMSNTEDLVAAVPDDVLAICRRLGERGKRGWVVGGCLRDLLRGKPVKDWDIATDARPEEVTELFRKVIPTGIQHGTVTVLIRGEPYEVTTLRGEGEYLDGRRPEVVVFLDDIIDDLARRDFTFNAIALDPLRGDLVDPFGGREDLAARLVRAVGNARDRFNEDGLRIMRAARFAARLECAIEEQTLAAMSDPQCLDTFAKVSIERVHDEWLKMMHARQPSIAFEVMFDCGMLAITCSELARLVDLPDEGSDNVWQHTLSVVDGCEPDPILRVAALLHDIAHGETNHAARGAAVADRILKRMKFSTRDRERAVHLVRHHAVAYQPDWSDTQLRRWLKDVGAEAAGDVLRLVRANLPDHADDVGDMASRVDAILAAKHPLTTRELALDGKALMSQLQLKPGRHLGELLGALLDRVLDDPALNTRDTLLAEARAMVAERDPG